MSSVTSAEKLPLVVIGGGAAGFFGAVHLAEEQLSRKVWLLEKNRQVLSKVRVSGGGRCNVTHFCFDPSLLVKNYPRGSLELRGPFSRFQPKDTVAWFEKRGVALKVEADGRMFPVTDSSETVIDCLFSSAKKAGVQIVTERGVEKIEPQDDSFCLELSDGSQLMAKAVLFATGSSAKVFELLKALGHTIVSPVPSLFTFNTPSSPLLKLSGVALADAEISLPALKKKQRGAVLLTHFGFSGPAALKLSAFAARELHAVNYRAKISLDFLPSISFEECKSILEETKKAFPVRNIGNECPFELSKALWKTLLEMAGIDPASKYAQLSLKQLTRLIELLKTSSFDVEGKTTNKEEFVTAGGVELKEVDFKTMQSRIVPGVYFAGEVLNIDGITGGFNFQNAWTTSWIAAQAMKNS